MRVFVVSIVVTMQMLVVERLMAMDMRVTFHGEQRDRRNEQRAGDDACNRQRLAEHDHGQHHAKKGAVEKTICERVAPSACADVM